MTSETDLQDALSEPETQAEEAPKPDARMLDFETLQKLRKAGFPKPDGVSWPQWLGLKKLSTRHHYIAFLAAVGKSQKEICEETGMSPSRMSIVMNSQRMRQEVARIQNEHFGKNTAERFMQMLPKATKFYDDMLNTQDQQSRGLKFKVAKDLMDRALGKPKETVEIKNNSVRELYLFLDQIRTGQKSLDLKPASPQPQKQSRASAEVIDTTATPVPTKTDEFSQIDDWIAKNVPRSSGLGKKE